MIDPLKANKFSIAKYKALKNLNSHQPQHPPEIYFIRRNEQYMSKFMDDKEMNKLVKRANPKNAFNYSHFKL